MQAPNVCGGYITGDSGSIEVMHLVRYSGSIKFRLELIETSAREVFFSSDAVSSLARFDPKYKYLSSKWLYTLQARISGHAVCKISNYC